MSGSGPDAVLGFWFDTLKPAQWWRKSPNLDDRIKAQFGDLLKQARACELYKWRQTVRGCLAEILILDQFSRHIHRGLPDAFAADPQALVVAQFVLASGRDLSMNPTQRQFVYMPMMHSESQIIQRQSLQVFEQLDNPDALASARRHHDIIQRFGRYPHRNAILGRPSTEEERLFLAQPGSRF